MKKIASPLAEMKDTYDVIVIGSGYGGSIAASRLSRAGQKVCLLERGREIIPGEYPNTFKTARKEFQINMASRQIGPDTGMFDMHVYDDIQILVGCGLGGTSLINANVSIQPEPRIFEDQRWPKIIREEFKDSNSMLQKAYQKAEIMLKPTETPDKVKLKKLDALETAAKAVDEKFYRTRINVNFDIDGPNHVGVNQKPCNNCGDCCSGCNYYAKNTLLMNYLPDAKNYGAEIFCEAKVSYIKKQGDFYEVYYQTTGTGMEKFDAPLTFVKASKVIVAAGTMGSTEIMLRSKQNGLQISNQIGHHFSGNGDVLGFGYNTDTDINGVGAGSSDRYKSRPVGPCITGIIDAREKERLDDGMIIEDAAIPGAIAPLLSGAMAVLDTTIGDKFRSEKTFKYRVKQWIRKWDSILRGAYHGAIRNTQTFLVMSTDSSKGMMSLENDRLQLKFPGVGSEHIYSLVDAKLKKATEHSKGDYVRNPVWSKAMGKDLTTVHPLGGCAMGEDYENGVVNHKGQVYSPDGIHEGLYIMDGSILPRAVGVNPLITISALAERACEIMAEDHGWTIDYGFHQKGSNVGVVQKVGIQFTETMKGFISTDTSLPTFESSARKGEDEGAEIQFTLTITSSDLYNMIDSPEHSAGITGVVTAPLLSDQPMSVHQGVFNLFVDDLTNVNVKLMKYSMKLNTTDGRQYFFYGYKKVHNEKNRLDMWPDTSTLFTTIYEGDNMRGKIVARGILKIKIKDFAKQMTTIKAINAASDADSIKAVADFSKFFSSAIFEVYGRALVPDKWFNANAKPRIKRPLRMDMPESYPLITDDGLSLMLTRYKGGDKGPLLMLHGFSGNRLTFSIDTIDTNAAEYFYEHGYDVWLYDYRLSSLVEGAKEQHTLDEVALIDLPNAIDKIIAITGVSQIDVLAHCVGSISMFMSLMSGKLENKIRSMVSAQIAINFVPQNQVKLKTGLHLPDLLHDMGISTLTAYTDSNASWEERLYDEFIKLYADHSQEFCTDPSCQRMCFMFGPLIEHAQLNDATHSATIEMFGTANVRSYQQLSLMINKNRVLNAKGEDVYMPGIHNLNIPITFIHGEKNGLFHVASTHDTYELLCKTNGPEKYQHHVIKKYGHNDCMYGKNASKDVFPIALKHFEESNSRRTVAK